MILATVTRKGAIGLKAKGARSRQLLHGLKYVHTPEGRRGVGAVWWPYAQDLRRDLGDRLRYTRGSRARLRVILAQTLQAKRGNDREALRAFNEDKRPYDYQFEGIHFLINVERALLADDTGLGKTIELLGALGVLLDRGDVTRAMIVVPSGLRHQWFEEAVEFLRPDLMDNCTVVVGTPEQRHALYNMPWKILITSHDLIRQDELKLKPIRKTIEFVALDEASVIRNPEAAISITMKRLFRHARYRYAMTATPVENKLADLRSVFDFVDSRVFPSKEFFNKRYVVWRKRYVQVRRKNGGKFRLKTLHPDRYIHLREVRHKIRPVYIRRRVRDVGIELPKLVTQNILLRLPKRQRDVYDSIKEATLEETADLRGEALIAPLQAFRQACNSTELVTRRGRKKSIKVERIKALLDTELAGEQVLIFTDYERFARIIARELKSYGVVTYTGKMEKRGRTSSIRKFKNGDARILIGTRALERGHNLQMAAVVINGDLPFNPAALKQRIGRIRRIGSRFLTVRMINLIAQDTVEERLVLQRIYQKRRLFTRLLGDDDLSDGDPMSRMRGKDLRGML